jgi:alpha-L-fucosidase
MPFEQQQPYSWEACMTIGEYWQYSIKDKQLKSARELIRILVDVVSRGGNLLLNVGPTPDGEIPEPMVERLHGVGAWLQVNGESIYGCGRAPFAADEAIGLATAKGNTVYLHVFDWPGEELAMSGLNVRVASAKMLATGDRVRVKQDGDRLILSGLPVRAPDPWDSVIALKTK